MPQQSYTATAVGEIAGPVDAGVGNTYKNYNLKAFGAPDCVLALETSPDDTVWTEQDRVTGPNWAYTSLHHPARAARVNVVSLGAAGNPVGAVLTYHS